MENLKNKAYQGLRSSESFFKTDMVYATKGGSWLTFGHGIAMLSGFILSIAFANLFPKESFGNYKFILSMVGIVGAFSLTGMGTAIVQSVARNFNTLRQGFRINLRWSVGIFIGGVALSIYYYVNSNFLLSLAFLLAGILQPIISSANLYTSYLLGKKDFKRSSLYGMVHNIVPSASIIITLLLTNSLYVIVTVYFVVGTLVSLFLYYKTNKAYQKEKIREDPSGLLSYSGHLSAMGIIGQVASFLDKILIFHYLGAAPLAIYAFAIAPVEQLQGGKKIFGALMIPKLSQRSFEELQRSTPRKAVILTVYAIGLIIIYVIVAPYFYKLLYPQYLDSVFYSQIYSLTLLAISGTVFNETLVAHKKTKELYIYRTTIPLVTIALFIILLPTYGLMGLIVSHITIRCLSTVLGCYLVMHPFK